LLSQRGHDVFCLDRRGSGVNRENREFCSGHVDSFHTLLADVRSFMEPLWDRYDSVYLVGLSWGGKPATACAFQSAENLAGLILITPGIRSLLDLSLRQKLLVAGSVLLSGRQMFPIPIEPEMFTNTPRFLQFIQEDPLRLREVSARFLFESRRLEKWLDAHIGELRIPVQLFLAGNDRIIDNDAVDRFFKQAGLTELEMQVYEDQTHSIQFDAVERLVGDMDRWITEIRSDKAQ
jgi:alpha-beta hydrolase superfamily lysophospholipase